MLINNILIRGFVSNPDNWSRLVAADLSNFFEDESRSIFNDDWHDLRGTLLFHDQEPLLYKSQKEIWDKFIFRQSVFDDRLMIVHSEINSTELDSFCKDHNAIPIHWFSNGALAYEWYSTDIFRIFDTEFQQLNQINYKFSCINRLIGQQRVYRPILSATLESVLDHRDIKLSCNIIDQHSGKHASDLVTDIMPAHHKDILRSLKNRQDKIAINISQDEIEMGDMNWAPYLLRGQYFKDVFCHIATETMFYDDAIHLTEKSLRAFINLRPMILVGPAGSLKYLRSYGFKTFENFWDESYDEEIDSNKRLDKIINLIVDLSKLSISDMRNMLFEMKDILIHNRNHFFLEFPKIIHDELLSNANNAIKIYKETRPNGWMLQRLSSFTKKEFEKILNVKKIPEDTPPEIIFDRLRAGSRTEQDNNVIRFLHRHLGLSDINTPADALNKIQQILD